MILCHCRLVSDRAVRQAVLAGATDLAAVAEACGGAGAACGGCQDALESVLDAVVTPVRMAATAA